MNPKNYDPPLTRRRRNNGLPSWLANLLLFGLLVALVLATFLWQMQRINATMQHNATERSRLVADVIEENLRNADLAEQTFEKIIRTFLDEKSGFIEYLDTIEPLQPDELTALAREIGLVGIILVRPSGAIISGPEGWLSRVPDCTPVPSLLHYDRKNRIGYTIYPGEDKTAELSCIIVGIDATRILAFRDQTALPVLLAALSDLPGINYVRLDKKNPQDPEDGTPVRLLRKDGVYTAEARVTTSRGTLVVGLDAQHFINRRTALRNQFILFGLLLLGLGVFFSFLLYRYQQRDLEQTRNFERLMAREHEAAALGRATATIAHEVRNPLNAINMGLQRLSLESDNLTRDQEKLISAMREAVDRTATIVTELQRFTRELRPQPIPFRIDRMIRQQLILYEPLCRQYNIAISSHLDFDHAFAGDRELLAELVENLLKNAVDAQPEGGWIRIGLRSEEGRLILEIANRGFCLSPEEYQRLGEPYFTTRTRGTGLGLALCRRIAEAHGGRIVFLPDPDAETLTIRVEFPRDGLPFVTRQRA